MPRTRKPLSFNNNKSDVNEARLEEFVRKGFINKEGEPAWANKPLVEIELEKIRLPSFQIRLYYDRIKIEQIKATIRSFGIRQPLLLRPHPKKEGFYELVAGSQRRLSAQELNFSSVPARIDDVDDITALKIALLENDARSDPNPYEKARGTLRLLELSLKKPPEEVIQVLIALFNSENRDSDNNVIINSQEPKKILQIFEEQGTSWKSFVTNYIPLFKIPENVKQALEKGQLEYTKALKIAKIKNDKNREQLLLQVLEEGMSLREINNRIKQLEPQQQKKESVVLRERARTALKKATSTQLMKNPQVFKQIKKMTSQLETLIEQAEKQAEKSSG